MSGLKIYRLSGESFAPRQAGVGVTTVREFPCLYCSGHGVVAAGRWRCTSCDSTGWKETQVTRFPGGLEIRAQSHAPARVTLSTTWGQV